MHWWFCCLLELNLTFIRPQAKNSAINLVSMFNNWLLIYLMDYVRKILNFQCVFTSSMCWSDWLLLKGQKTCWHLTSSHVALLLFFHQQGSSLVNTLTISRSNSDGVIVSLLMNEIGVKIKTSTTYFQPLCAAKNVFQTQRSLFEIPLELPDIRIQAQPNTNVYKVMLKHI